MKTAVFTLVLTSFWVRHHAEDGPCDCVPFDQCLSDPPHGSTAAAVCTTANGTDGVCCDHLDRSLGECTPLILCPPVRRPGVRPCSLADGSGGVICPAAAASGGEERVPPRPAGLIRAALAAEEGSFSPEEAQRTASRAAALLAELEDRLSPYVQHPASGAAGLGGLQTAAAGDRSVAQEVGRIGLQRLFTIQAISNQTKLLSGTQSSLSDAGEDIRRHIPGCVPVADVPCDRSTAGVRTIGGQCNNLEHPFLGRALTGLGRLADATYEDGLYFTPRSLATDGSRLPASDVAGALVSAQSDMKPLGDWASVISEFIALDLARIGPFRLASGREPSCCSEHHPACLPLRVSGRCVSFVRALPAAELDCAMRPGAPLSAASALLDLEPLYGSSEEAARRLRTFRGGRLRTDHGLLVDVTEQVLDLDHHLLEAIEPSASPPESSDGTLRSRRAAESPRDAGARQPEGTLPVSQSAQQRTRPARAVAPDSKEGQGETRPKGDDGDIGAAGRNDIQRTGVPQNGDGKVIVCRGPRGRRGPRGPKGLQGDTGEKGMKGMKGETGMKGAKGEKGEKGMRGRKGCRGRNGKKGQKGYKGEDGGRGLQGEKGRKGEMGVKGETGLKGAKGEKGVKGETGRNGKKGQKGHKGEDGGRGYKGEKGRKGEMGVKGETGLKGAKGEKGVKGETGRNGKKGQKGHKGEDGGRGLQGEKGRKGEMGVKGETGLKGAKGEKGVKGETGRNGKKGQKGHKGEDGGRGLQGEKGQKGEMGVKGETGLKGAKGEKGVKGETGMKGNKGQKGYKGDDGDRGYKGEKGQKGEMGVKGEIGEKGMQGSRGEIGVKGETGAKGEIGQTGFDGPQGPKGTKGDTGERGLKGDTGPQGEVGYTGPIGPQGERGFRGPAGRDGRPGARGPPGEIRVLRPAEHVQPGHGHGRRPWAPEWRSTPGERGAPTPSPDTLNRLLLREHNRVAAALRLGHPSWEDERLFQAARRVLIAQWQHIVYHEYLPHVLGAHAAATIATDGDEYDEQVDPTVSVEFALAAFRFWQRAPAEQSGRVAPQVTSSAAFLALLRGPSGGEHDSALASELAAVEVLRGRELGLPTYAEVRRLCSGGAAHTWEELQAVLRPADLQSLRDTYTSPGDVDLWVGGMLERAASQAKVGPTFQCVMAEQFGRLRRADRFWHEFSLSGEQLREVRSASLARLLCDHEKGRRDVTPLVLEPRAAEWNQPVLCTTSAVPRLNLTVF